MAGQDNGRRRGMMKAGWELAFGVARSDFSTSELPELDWGPGQASASLSRVYQHSSAQCHDAITWYLQSMHGKRRGAVAFRLGAIVAAAAAGILPILTMIFTTDGRPAFSPAWASVAIGIAAALVLFDRFFGSSTGWMRFIRTEMHLRQLHQEFEMNWERERAASGPSGQGRTPAPSRSSRCLGAPWPSSRGSARSSGRRRRSGSWSSRALCVSSTKPPAKGQRRQGRLRLRGEAVPLACGACVNTRLRPPSLRLRSGQA